MSDLEFIPDPHGSKNDLRLVLFGDRLKTYRLQRKMSLRDASEAIGVDKNTIMKIESGSPVRDEIRKKICNFYRLVSYDPLSRPLAATLGKNYAVHNPKKAVWYMIKANESKLVATTNEAIQNESERLRLGRAGLVKRFYKSMQTRMVGNSMGSSIVELYSRTESEHPSQGYFYVYCIRGALKITVDDESFIVDEGSCATHRIDVPNFMEPATPVGLHGFPTIILMVDFV